MSRPGCFGFSTQSQSSRRASGRFTPDSGPVVSLQFPLLNACGVSNPANFCYQNAVLQALLRTCASFTTQVFALSLVVSSPLLVGLRNLALTFAHPGARVVAPVSYRFQNTAEDWSGFTQQDACEFLDLALFPELHEQFSFDLSSFTGEMAIDRSCGCGSTLGHVDKFSALYVEPSENLRQCIKTSMAPESKSAESRCTTCGSVAYVERRSITSAPDSLIVKFNRNGSDQNSVSKTHVRIPDDFSVDTRDGPVQYRVSASVEFIGATPHTGHYVCKVQGDRGRWTLFDDAAAPVNSTVDGKNAYILFCHKISSLPTNPLPIDLPVDLLQSFRLSTWPNADSPQQIALLADEHAPAPPVHNAVPSKPQSVVTTRYGRVVNPPGRHADYETEPAKKNIKTNKAANLRPVKLGDGHIDLLTTQEFDAMLERYNEELRGLIEEVESCPVCREVRPNLNLKDIKYDKSVPKKSRKYARACTRCRKEIENSQELPARFSAENNMIPSAVPDTLRDLTSVEEALIARVSAVMAVYNLRHGASAARGHVVAVPADLSSLEKALSLPPSKVDIVVVSREMYDGSVRDFYVRKSKVANALKWLKEHNPLYADIRIDEDVLAKLPEGGQYPNLNVRVDPAFSAEIPDAGPQVEVDDTAAGFTSSVFPNVSDNNTERGKIRRSLHGQNPLRLSDVSGLLTMAFPALFPDGRGDLSLASGRIRPVTLHDYLAHLLHLDDQRFANDRRLPYFLFNTYFRERVTSTASVFVRKNPLITSLTISELKEALEQVGDTGEGGTSDGANAKAEALIRSASAWTGSFPGTRQFWQRTKSRLISMIRQLGQPHLFCTHSFADFHCPDLREHLSKRLGVQVTDANQKAIVLRNPGLVNRFLYAKFKLIFQHFYVDILGVKDFFLRIEYQGRGAIHVHAILWLDPSLNIADVNVLKNVVTSLISTWHPEPEYRHEGPHPCKQVIDYENLLKQGSEVVQETIKKLVHHVQRHHCSPGYCVKGANSACRFGFPKPLVPETSVLQNADGRFEVTTARNDHLINNFNGCLSLLFRANHDIQVITSLEAAIGYVAKYTSKPEIQSSSLKEIARTCLTKCADDNDDVAKFVKLLMNASLVDRDFYQQEVVHIGVGLPLCEFSRTFVTINENDSFRVEDDDCDLKSSVENYLNRLPHATEAASGSTDGVLRRSMWGLYKWFNKQARNVWKRAPNARVVIAYPRLPKLIEGQLNEDWCKAHLTFHKVYYSRAEIRGEFTSYAEAYSAWLDLPGDHPSKDPDYRPKTYDDWPLPVRANPLHRVGVDEIEPSPNGGMAAHERIPASLAAIVSESQLAYSGPPPAHVGSFVPDPQRLIFTDASLDVAFHKENLKEGSPLHLENVDAPVADRVGMLTHKQRELYDCVADHLVSSSTSSVPPLRVVVHGTAGTGKSFVIAALVDLLGDTCVTLAPTGVAASNICGQTMHSFACLFPGGSKDIPPRKLAQLQEKYARVRYIIVDEMSMVGTKAFANFSSRLNQIFPSDGFLGGRSVLLFGDFGQLPPVKDSPLFETKSKPSVDCSIGAAAYRSFDRGIVLDQVMRQAVVGNANDKDKEDAANFMSVLNNLRTCGLRDIDFNFLSRRQGHQLASHQLPDVIHLFGSNRDASGHNRAVLQNFVNVEDLPRVTFDARTSVREERMAKAENAVGLEPNLTLVVGARVMLTANINVSTGLVNGSIGVVMGFGPIDACGMPAVVMVKFDGYRGPTHKDAHGCVGILPVDREWLHRKFGTVKRTMIPLRLAWAITVHKSQGLTLPYVVVDLRSLSGNKLKLAFVAVSRVKKFENLFFLVGDEGIIEWFRKVSCSDTSAKVAAKKLKQEENRISSLGLRSSSNR